MKAICFILLVSMIISPLGVLSTAKPVAFAISKWRLFFNENEIANSTTQTGRSLITVPLSPKSFKPTDTLHFKWQMDVITDDTLLINLYLGKERSPVLVSAEKSTGFYYGKIAASRIQKLSDSLSTNSLLLQFTMKNDKPRSLLKIKLKD